MTGGAKDSRQDEIGKESNARQHELRRNEGMMVDKIKRKWKKNDKVQMDGGKKSRSKRQGDNVKGKWGDYDGRQDEGMMGNKMMGN